MTIRQLLANLECYKKGGQTTTTFIMENYKPSTLPRMFYDLKMTVKQIDSNKKIRQHILNDGLKCGFAQDNLFEAILSTKNNDIETLKKKAVSQAIETVDKMSNEQVLELANLLGIK
jgi:hypothetical protein